MQLTGSKLLSIIKEHKAGNAVGITSVCSGNEYVIKAAVLNAKINSGTLLVESTSNQVDQFGGYTGMTPMDFRNYVYSIADSSAFPADNIILGGDHLGPNVWTNLPAREAMENAKGQLKAYAAAGYTKMHLDTSMKCADDGDPDKPLVAAVAAKRAAELCRAAEDELQYNRFKQLPVYVIGTDVPPPGGAKQGNHGFEITKAESVEETIRLTHKYFMEYGLEDAWQRVIAVVVQPGVEFGDSEVYDYRREPAADLKKTIETKDNLVYEAHSTDYQVKESLRELVEDHFTILKVGPWLTYAFREAVFGLESVEKELFSGSRSVILSSVSDVIELCMQNNPVYWRKYYSGGSEWEMKFKRKYSMSDRIRYYWNKPEVQESLKRLLQNLSAVEIPITLLSQYLPDVYEALRNGELSNTPGMFIIHRIMGVLGKYNYATAGTKL